MRKLSCLQRVRGKERQHAHTQRESNTYSLLLVYYSGAAITSSMRAPWSNAEDLGITATRGGVEQTRRKWIKKKNKNN